MFFCKHDFKLCMSLCVQACVYVCKYVSVIQSCLLPAMYHCNFYQRWTLLLVAVALVTTVAVAALILDIQLRRIMCFLIVKYLILCTCSISFSDFLNFTLMDVSIPVIFMNCNKTLFEKILEVYSTYAYIENTR